MKERTDVRESGPQFDVRLVDEMNDAPAQFTRNTIDVHGSIGVEWLSRLPGLISDCESRWSISVQRPFELLSYNYVAPAIRSDGTPAVLKLGVPNRELKTEIGTRSQPRTISEVTEQIGLSPRRFIQLFSEEVGLTPKLFCRVRRFQQVLRSLQHGTLNGRQIDWADIASSCGYFDQAHFIRDFRAFSGLNPTAWLPLRGEHINHVRIPD